MACGYQIGIIGGDSLDCRFEVVTTDDVDGALQALEDARIPIVLCDRELGDTWKTLLAGLAQLKTRRF